MFYEHNQVDDLLTCPNCNDRYDIPYLLPCFRTICNKCIKKQTDKNYKLNCPFCTDIKHNIPKHGYVINDALNSLLKLKPVDVHRAEMYRRIADLLKMIQISINDLENLEVNVKLNLFDYFELIKKEIQKSADNVIKQTIEYKEKLLSEIDYLKKQSSDCFKELINGSLLKLKKKCVNKKKEWQSSIEMRSNETNNSEKMNQIINEANLMNDQLNETKLFIQNTITSRKLVYNQADQTISMSSLIGQLDFNDDAFDMIDHRLKINFLNDLVKVNVYNLEPDQIRQTSYLVPMIYQRILNVSKTSYDQFSNYSICIYDLNGKILAKNLDIFGAKVNAVGSYGNHILIALTDQKTKREMIKLYNSSLNLISKVYIESICDAFYLNDMFIYAKLNATYPFVLKYNYELEKKSLFENFQKSNELFVSFVVDKLIYFSSNSDRIYFNDKCFSRLKIYSENTGDLLTSIHVNNLRDCSIRIDASLNNSVNDQFICLNKSEGWLRCYDVNNLMNDEDENNRMENKSNNILPNLVAENFLSDKIKNISNFYLTKDGYYAFIDHLNDTIYFY